MRWVLALELVGRSTVAERHHSCVQDCGGCRAADGCAADMAVVAVESVLGSLASMAATRYFGVVEQERLLS